MKSFIKNKIIPFLGHPVLKKIQRFRDIHKGEECYIFGDGSSVKYFDLKSFSDKISIPCAYLPFHNDFSLLNVPYAFCVESFWFYPYNKVTIPPYQWLPNDIQNMYHSIIKKRKDIEFFLSITNYPTVWNKNVTYIYGNWVDPQLPADHIGRKFDCYTGSIRASIFLAIYMGFQKIYLVGFDYTHKPARTFHWYENGKGGFLDHVNYQKDFFVSAQEYADIYTVTLDGTSEFLKPVSYEELTGSKPKYRENNEILTAEAMKILATWPDYVIY